MSVSSGPRKVKVSRESLKRFDFESMPKLRSIKAKAKESTELRRRLKEDPQGTLRAEGLKVDDEFKRKFRMAWKSQVQADVREKMLSKPPSDRRMFQRVVEGKPLKLRIIIDPDTGERSIILREED